MVSRGRAEHYSSHPLMAGIPSVYIQRIAVRILDARRFAKMLLVADLLGRIPIHQHPTILTGEPLRVTQTLAAEGKVSTSFLSKMENRAKRKIKHSFTGGQKFWGGKEWSDYNEVASES